MYSKRPQTLGSGSTVRYIEFSYVPTTNNTTIDFQQKLVDHEEFVSFCQRYRYVTIKKVMVVIPPNSSNGELLLYAQWNSEADVDDLENNDSTKRIAIHTVREQKRTFLPPDMPSTGTFTTSTGSNLVSTVQLRGVNSTDLIFVHGATRDYVNYPFRLTTRVSHSVTNLTCRIYVVCHFQSEKYNSSINKYIKFKDDPILKQRLNELQQNKNAITKKIFDESFHEAIEKREIVRPGIDDRTGRNDFIIYMLNDILEQYDIEPIDYEECKHAEVGTFLTIIAEYIDVFNLKQLNDFMEYFKRSQLTKQDMPKFDILKKQIRKLVEEKTREKFARYKCESNNSSREEKEILTSLNSILNEYEKANKSAVESIKRQKIEEEIKKKEDEQKIKEEDEIEKQRKKKEQMEFKISVLEEQLDRELSNYGFNFYNRFIKAMSKYDVHEKLISRIDLAKNVMRSKGICYDQKFDKNVDKISLLVRIMLKLDRLYRGINPSKEQIDKRVEDIVREYNFKTIMKIST
jgi:hypothetical protein